MDLGAYYYNNYLVDNWWPIILSGLLTVIIVIRTYVGGPDCPSTNKIFGKIVLITGASGGLGFETAKELAARGAHIILTCRNEEKGKKAIETIKQLNPTAKIDLKFLDVSILNNIEEFVKEIKKDYLKLDILINNAGIIFHPYEKTSEGLEITMATNYLGPFALTHLLLPLLNKSDNGRIINISALAHFSAKLNIEDFTTEKEFDSSEMFGQTKLALLMFTRHLAKSLKSTKITINAVNPGLVRNTSHLKNSRLETSLPAKVSVWPWMWLFMKTPKQGIQTIIYAAVDPCLKVISGAYLSDCAVQQPSTIARDDYLAKELYNVSCKICKVDGEAIVNKLLQSEEDECEEIS